MSKVYLHLLGNYASSYYRQRLPHKHAQVEGVKVTCESDLTHLDYDTFWLPLLLNPNFLPVVETLKRGGRKIVWESDDDLWRIPAWNPAAKAYNWQAVATVNWIARLADEVVVTTEALKATAARCAQIPLDKITVLPNLMDLDDWPEPGPRPPGPLRVLWAGSQHHDLDLLEIVEPMERIMADYGDKVEVCFFGDWPESMMQWARIRYTHLSCQIPKAEYPRLYFVNPVSLADYPRTLCALRPDIALAPLCDVRFNDSKSGIKWYEGALAGAAVVATDLPPYADIRPGIDGLKVRCGDKQGWYEAISALLDHPDWRGSVAERGRARVINEFSWQQGPGKARWEDFVRRLK